MTEIRRSRSSSVMSRLRSSGDLMYVGFQRRRRSRAGQWGRSSERKGVRLVGYLCEYLIKRDSCAKRSEEKRAFGWERVEIVSVRSDEV